MSNDKIKHLLKGWIIRPGCNLSMDPNDQEWKRNIIKYKKIKIFLKEKNFQKEYYAIGGFTIGEIYRLINNTIFTAAEHFGDDIYPSKIAIIGFEFYPDNKTIIPLCKNL